MLQQSIIDTSVTLAISTGCFEHVLLPYIVFLFVFCKELLFAIRFFKKERNKMHFSVTEIMLFILHMCVMLAVEMSNIM